MSYGSGVRPPAGFSLVEVLVAVVLLSVGALAAVTVQRTTVRTDQSAFTREVAASLAGQLLEATKNLEYDDARIADTGGAWVAPHASLLAAAPSFYTRDWTIDNEEAANPANVVRKTIRARIRWNQSGRNQEIVVSTVKAW
jgi:type IV pilus modification protein PilV